jgi:glycosyltransferase involved in cell wall biosynthesis
MIKLSIIIPAYNAEETIEATLRSILRQNMEDVEIIVVNDGSTDSTPEIVNRIKAGNCSSTSIYLINNSLRGGVSQARNIALKAVQGRYWTCVDADDEVADGGLQAMLAAAERDGYPDIVYGGVEYHQFDGTIKKVGYRNATIKGSDTAAKIISIIDYYVIVSFSFKIFNRQFTVDSGLIVKPEMECGEDADYIWRLMPKMTSATIVSDVTYKYLQYNSHASKKAHIKDYHALYNTITDNLHQILSGQQLDEYRKYIEERFINIIYYQAKLLYKFNLPHKLSVLKEIKWCVKSLGLKPTQHFKSGLPRLFWQTLKVSPFAAKLLLSTIYNIPALRKRLSC